MKAKLLIAALAFASQAASAGVINGTFDTNLNGWTSNGTVVVAKNGTSSYAYLTAGLGNGIYTTLTQTVFLNAGDILSGSADFFSAEASSTYNDDAYVSINGTKVFVSSVQAVGSKVTSTGWTAFDYKALTSGNYLISAGVANRGDNSVSSSLGLDNVQVKAVPEPASIALMGVGLFGAFFARRRKA